MKLKINFKTISVLVVFLISFSFQIIIYGNAKAATINGGVEFFTGRSNICKSSNCDALAQWGVYSCVYSAANSGHFINGGFNGGYNAFQNATANNNISDRNAYIFVEALLAYYYGVDATNTCPKPVINTGLTNMTSIASLDNIGATFDILSLLDGNNVPSNDFSYNGTYATLNGSASVSSFISIVTEYANPNKKLVCQLDLPDQYNTAMDISSGSYDVGSAPLDTAPRLMIGFLKPQYANKCSDSTISTNQQNYLDLIDIICGNFTSHPNKLNPIPGPATCQIAATPSYSPSPGSQISVYINWNVPDKSYNPYATQVKNVVVQKRVNGGALSGNIVPNQLRGTEQLGPNGYTWNQGNSSSNPITLIDSPTLTSGTVIYYGSLTYTTNTGQDINVPQCQASITWGGSPSCLNPGSCSGSTSLACTAAGLAQEAAQKNVYNPAYNNWFNYDQGSYQGSTFWDGYQHYKTATDNAAVALDPYLATYLSYYNAYLNDVAAVTALKAWYNGVLNSEPQPPAPFSYPSFSYPAFSYPSFSYPAFSYPPFSYSGPAKGRAAAANAYNAAHAAAARAYNQARASAYNSYIQGYDSAINSYNQGYYSAVNSYYSGYNAALNSYNTALANYNTALAYYKNVTLPQATAYYNKQLPIDLAQESKDQAAATAAWNAMQPYYKPWLNLSDNTYYQTMNYPLLAPWYPTYNSNSFYNQDLNLYNASVSALNVWKTAYQNQATICDSQPYFTVSGGDIIAGSGSANSNGFCSPNYSANIFASNVGGSSWAGASDNLSALAPSVINGLSTGSGGDALTFANTVNAPYGGNFGSANGVCNLDYYSTKNNLVGFSVYPASGAFDLSTATGNSACKLIDTTNYCSLNGPIKISGNPPAGSKVVIYVNGSAEISGNISIYNNGSGLNSAADIPLLYVISNSNIYIDSAATSIDGVYSANGTIFTCANAGNSFSGNQADQALIAGCTNQLTVNGSLVANQIKFGRVYGGLPGQYGSTGAAETFNYGPEVWLSQVQGSLPVNPDYQALTELSPVI